MKLQCKLHDDKHGQDPHSAICVRHDYEDVRQLIKHLSSSDRSCVTLRELQLDD